MTSQLEALIADMKAAAELIAGGYKSEWGVHHDIENSRARLGCLDDDGQLSEFVEVSISDYSGNDRHDIELADFYVKANPVSVLALIAELEQSQKSNEFLKEQLSKLAKFNPDWDMLQACQTSWKEVSAELHSARKHIAELEANQLAVKLPPHKYSECVNGLLEEAIAYAGTQQLRARLSARLSNFVKPDHAAGITVQGGGES